MSGPKKHTTPMVELLVGGHYSTSGSSAPSTFRGSYDPAGSHSDSSTRVTMYIKK